MGTSASSKGPGSDTPLVPPWADSLPGQPLPPPPETPRFQTFRLNLGKFVGSTDQKYLRRAVGEYARNATGGASVGPRRFGSVTNVGGALYGVINDLRQGGNAESVIGIDLSGLNGRDIDFAIQEIVSALTPHDGDADKIRVAMTTALSECLEGFDEFDATTIDDVMMVDLLVYYLRETVFEQIVMDSDKAFQKSTSVNIIAAEEALHSLVESVVDNHMRKLFSEDVSLLTANQVCDIQLKAISEIWKEWESYDYD